MHPALDDSSGCVRLRNASDSRAIARSAAGSPVPDAKVRRHDDLARAVQPAEVVSELHLGNRHVDEVARLRDERDPFDELADEPALEVRVAEHRPADRSRRSRPGFQPRHAAIDRPAHEAVDRDARVRPHGRRIPRADLASMHTDDQAADPVVGDQHVRAAAEDRHRHGGVARDPHRDAQARRFRADRGASRRARRP